jgi:PAP2 superfamily C-terminal
MSPPARFPGTVWLAVLGSLVVVYAFMFSVVHVAVDMRACVAVLPDPLLRLVPLDIRWAVVTRTIYAGVTASASVAMLVLALRGNHRPALRFASALAITALMRSVTVMLLPLCRASVAAGTVVLSEAPMVQLGPLRFPFRLYATNDLVFSGHVAELLMLYWAAARYWPVSVRALLVVFQVLQAYGLLATRGHYTVDMVVAVPFAFLADRIACWMLDGAAARRRPELKADPAVACSGRGR